MAQEQIKMAPCFGSDLYLSRGVWGLLSASRLAPLRSATCTFAAEVAREEEDNKRMSARVCEKLLFAGALALARSHPDRQLQSYNPSMDRCANVVVGWWRLQGAACPGMQSGIGY